MGDICEFYVIVFSLVYFQFLHYVNTTNENVIYLAFNIFRGVAIASPVGMADQSDRFPYHRGCGASGQFPDLCGHEEPGTTLQVVLTLPECSGHI